MNDGMTRYTPHQPAMTAIRRWRHSPHYAVTYRRTLVNACLQYARLPTMKMYGRVTRADGDRTLPLVLWRWREDVTQTNLTYRGGRDNRLSAAMSVTDDAGRRGCAPSQYLALCLPLPPVAWYHSLYFRCMYGRQRILIIWREHLNSGVWTGWRMMRVA